MRPVVTVLALPLIVLTLGIALFFVNLLMVELTDAIVGGFRVDGFWTLVAATLIVWLVNVALNAIFDLDDRKRAGPGHRPSPA